VQSLLGGAVVMEKLIQFVLNVGANYSSDCREQAQQVRLCALNCSGSASVRCAQQRCWRVTASGRLPICIAWSSMT